MPRPLIRWTFARAAAWLRLHGARVFDAADRTVGPVEIVRLLSDAPAPPIEDWLPATPTDARLEDDAALLRVARAFELGPVEVAALALIAAPALKVEAERLYRFLRADDRPLSVGFIAELASDEAIGFDQTVAALHPARTLARVGLIRLAPGVGQGRGVTISGDVLDALRGIEPTVAGRLAPVAPTPWPDQARLEAALATGGRLHLVGPPGAGRLAALTAASARPPVAIEVDAGTEPERLARAARIARLSAAPLALRIDTPIDPALIAALPERCVILTQAGTDLPAPRQRIDAPRPSLAQQSDRWRGGLGAGWAADLPARLAERFDLGFGLIDAIARDPGHDEAALLATIRARVPHRLGELAERSETRLGWDDVVLPDEAERTLREIVASARHQEVVLDGWGFDRLLPYGRGLGCLFAGPPGTGKTMMAGILANSLGRELFRVDVSRLVSKWLGETEKNLSALFAEAAKARAILFFDEADSLFARRTGVKSSNDRHANMEVNHLLQKMERHDGISILATNLEGSLDEAFKRRLRFVVHFEEPDAEARAVLWQRMIPARAPCAEGIRFGRLGRHFKLTGGHIKNAVVRAAYRAAAAGRVIDEGGLVEAAEAEVRALGRL